VLNIILCYLYIVYDLACSPLLVAILAELLIEVTKTHKNNHVAHEFQRPIYYSRFEQNIVPSLPDPDQRESERFAVACSTKHSILE
jgi:hypothetical protein